ncbi:MAG: CDF family Co(II)/Ni(II) efflux transporter DmeF [Alphaproteobacteria bacterium]|nr:CDF family Co(II)/Ni(II) efflux transporter DmeF [Alphaproteobacteria bacterium]
MTDVRTHSVSGGHSHVFLGEGHEHAERRTWMVIWLCGAMMALEIIGGVMFGSIALVADGLHMSTHAGALMLAALAYSFARKHAADPRFTFGTGKLGDLAGFTSAVILAMIAILIGYEAITRVIEPVPIHFAEAIPIACLGLAVNVASAWLLSSGGHHHHGHGRGHGHAHEHDGHEHDEEQRVVTPEGVLALRVFEENHPPVFRVHAEGRPTPAAGAVTIETVRRNGTHQTFVLESRDGYLQSVQEIPEPHEFTAHVRIGGRDYPVIFEEHEHSREDGRHADRDAAHRDNNMRAAIVHVLADAAVSVLVIAGLLLARAFGWLWMDPLAGIVGALVIASWSYALIRDTGAILLDMNPDRRVTEGVRQVVKENGDRLTDLHVWRVGPGHMAAILSVATASDREAAFYRERLAHFRSLSHVTIEVDRAA